MILVLVFAGFVVGGSAAVVALVGGWSFVAALVAYALFGACAVVVTAILIALGPSWRPRRAPPRPSFRFP